MTRLITVLFFFGCFFGSAHSEGFKPDSLKRVSKPLSADDKWFTRDKMDHAITSAFVTAFGYYVARKECELTVRGASRSAIGFSFSLGLGKEVYDCTLRKSRFSIKDIAADLVGSGIGLLLLRIDMD
jgi:putative lipoprotein